MSYRTTAEDKVKQGLDNKGLRIVCTIFFYYAMIIIPLYVENKYFNMLEAKWHVYSVGSIALLAVALCVVVLNYAVNRNRNRTIPQVLGFQKGLTLLDMALIAFAINAVLSSILSSNPRAAFWGMDGWHVGAFTISSLVLWYFILKNNLKLSHNAWLGVMAVNAFIVIIAILHAMEIDAFSLHLHAYYKQYHLYLSTLGNANWIVGYLSLLFPLFFGFYLISDDRASERIYEVFLFLLCMLMVLTASDGMYLGLGVTAFFLIPFIFQDGVRLRKTSIVLTMYGICLLSISILPAFSGKRDSMNGLSGFFIETYVAAAVIVIGLIGCFALRAGIEKDKLAKAGWVAEGVLAVFTIVYAARSINGFDEHWGTGRGWTWTNSIDKYGSFSTIEKLLGIGPELLRDYYKDTSEFFGRTLLVSHSEPIQILLTMGAAGLAIWVFICSLIISGYIKKRAWKNENCIYYLPLVAYIGQSFVNSAMTTNVAILTVILVLFRQRTE